MFNEEYYNNIYLLLYKHFDVSRNEYEKMLNLTELYGKDIKTNFITQPFVVNDKDKRYVYICLYPGVYLILEKEGDEWKSFKTTKLTKEFYKTLTYKQIIEEVT